MKKRVVAVALAAVVVAPAFAQVGVSVNIGEPGFYGQINLGDAPRPEVIYERPVIIQRDAGYGGEPLYLRVPPGHERHWERHCAQYGACGRPVYFVRNDWYNNVYAPRYRHEHGFDRDDRDHGPRRGRDRDFGPGPDRGPDHRDDRGPDGRDHGPDHGPGRDHDHD